MDLDGSKQFDKQKFAELFDTVAIYTVGRGIAPAGGRNSRICAALRRIRAMLRDVFLCSCGAEAAGAEENPRPTMSYGTATDRETSI